MTQQEQIEALQARIDALEQLTTCLADEIVSHLKWHAEDARFHRDRLQKQKEQENQSDAR